LATRIVWRSVLAGWIKDNGEQTQYRERLVDPAWSKNLACAEAPWTEPGDLAIDRSAIAAGPHREGEEP
jgi:hypothetical protein